MEATLYKSRIEIMRLEACNIMERIRNAGEGLAMTYDLYKLLIHAEDASEGSQEEFHQREEEGVLMDPKFTMDFEAEWNRMENESREGAFQQLKDMISELRQYVGERGGRLRYGKKKDPSPSDETDCIEPQWEFVEEDDVIGSLESEESEANLQEDTLDEVDEHAAGTNMRENTVDGGASYERSRKESIEASDAYSRRGSSETNVSQTIYPGAQRRKEIEARMTEIKIQIHNGKGIPERKICHANFMREQKRYMRCAFCLAKGMHYSDCCPIAPSVEVQKTKETVQPLPLRRPSHGLMHLAGAYTRILLGIRRTPRRTRDVRGLLWIINFRCGGVSRT
ncbi:hypothetical protein RB195_007364 [Necator americanus]|uniref:Uncharacterized protein n=1 Tax=Necator americanus TaxID=51031 RepID=A0ABR1BWZ6_NECAM